MMTFPFSIPLLLAAILPMVAQADDNANASSSTFDKWVYPDSRLLDEGRPTGVLPTSGTGQYTTEDSFEKVVRFYAKTAGLDLAAKPLDFTLPGSAGIVGVRSRDDAPSAILLRNAGEHTLSATLLYWTPGDSEKMAVSVTRGTGDTDTHIQLLFHRRK